jgi:hypothetical protein
MSLHFVQPVNPVRVIGVPDVFTIKKFVDMSRKAKSNDNKCVGNILGILCFG